MKRILMFLILISTFLYNQGICEGEHQLIDRGSNFKVLYLESHVSDFELENIIRDALEDRTQFNPSERECTIDIYVEREYWMTVRYNIQTGLKIIRRYLIWKQWAHWRKTAL